MLKPKRHGNRWRIRPVDPVTGKRTVLSFDDLGAAKVVAAKLNLEAERVKNGHVAEERIPDKTFSELCDYWMTTRAVLKRSRVDDESIIRSRLRPEFGHLLLRQITAQHVDQYSAKVVQPHCDYTGMERPGISKKTLANHLTLLKTMLNAAVDMLWLRSAPRFKKPKVRIFSADYAYLRTQEEIDRFLKAARELNVPTENMQDTTVQALEGLNEMGFTLYAAAIFTGLREGELAALQWSDVDFSTRIITVQRSFDGPTKAEDVRYVPILDPLLPILQNWKLKHPGHLVFTNRDGGPLQESARIFQDGVKRTLEKAGFPPRANAGRRVGYVTFHDLRHTFASHWVMNGGDLYKLQKILGHKTVQMTQRYAHLRRDAFAADFGRLGSKDLLAEVAEVVPFQKKTG